MVDLHSALIHQNPTSDKHVLVHFGWKLKLYEYVYCSQLFRFPPSTRQNEIDIERLFQFLSLRSHTRTHERTHTHTHLSVCLSVCLSLSLFLCCVYFLYIYFFYSFFENR